MIKIQTNEQKYKNKLWNEIQLKIQKYYFWIPKTKCHTLINFHKSGDEKGKKRGFFSNSQQKSL